MENKNYNSFMELNLSGHIGEWIAICNGKIVAKNKSIKKVYKEARKKCPNERPLIAKAPEKESMIF